MSLYNVYSQKRVNPKKFDNNEYLVLLRSRINPRSFKKLCRIFDAQIQAVNPTVKSNLSFSMLAKLVGYTSECPTKDSTYVWDTVWAAAKKHQRTANYMLGCLAQWRFCLDDREWMCCKKESGRKNEYDEDIAVTIYWIDHKKP